jgi:hypothetical protein
MKKLLLTALLVGLAAGAYAQGQVALDNNVNTNPSATATTGGLFFLNTGGGPVLINQDFNVSFYGGSDSTSLTLLRSFFGATATGDNAFGMGTFTDPQGVAATIPGATTVAFFRIEAWTGAATSWGAASSRNAPNLANPTVGGEIFSNPVATPPGTPPDFTSMPAITISAVPEPSMFALAGLGAAALLIFRRRK